MNHQELKDKFDDWRKNGNHKLVLGGDPIYWQEPNTGENNGDELFLRHEAFAAFRAGYRLGVTGNPFGPHQS